MYSPRAQSGVNESHIKPRLPKNNALIFHTGEVAELWRKTRVITSHVFNLSN